MRMRRIKKDGCVAEKIECHKFNFREESLLTDCCINEKCEVPLEGEISQEDGKKQNERLLLFNKVTQPSDREHQALFK